MSILNVSQSLSSEIEPEKLLATLLQVMLEHAGAEKCVLLLIQDDCLLLQGLATVGTQPTVLQQMPVESSQDIPLGLIYQVKHTLQSVVLMNGAADPALANDPYVLHHRPKSILLPFLCDKFEQAAASRRFPIRLLALLTFR